MNCKICHSNQLRNLHKKVMGSPKAQVIYCKECDYAFLTDAEISDEFYKNEFNTFMAERALDTSWKSSENHFQTRLPQGRERVTTLSKYLDLSSTHSVLEMGSSTGFVLQALKEKFPALKVFGVEPGEEYCDFANSRGIPTFQNSSKLPQKVDAVLSYFVLEHILEPLEWLKTLTTFCRPGARIVCVVPNLNEALVKAYQDPHYDQFVWQAPHVSYYTQKSLGMLFSKIAPSYQIHQNQRYSLSNHLNWLSGIKPKASLDYPHITPELNNLYKQSLEIHGLADCLIGIFSVA